MGIGPGEIPTQQDVDEFVDRYHDTPLGRFGGILTLGKALEMEANECEASVDERSEPAARINWMAKNIGREELAFEHQHLAPEITE